MALSTPNPIYAVRFQVETAIKQAVIQRRAWSVNPHIHCDVFKVFV